MVTQTPSFLKHEKYKLGIWLDGNYYIFKIEEDGWIICAGPYLTEEEAYPDLRNIICERQ